jgi:hypothetical protein
MGRVLLAAVAAWLVSGPAVLAQADAGDVGESHASYLARAAVQMIGSPTAVTAAAIRIGASEKPLLYPEWQILIETVPPLRRDWLDAIRDNTPIPDLRAKAPDEISKADRAFYLALNQAIYYAWITSPEVFHQAGLENNHITYTDLWQQPGRYRGQVVPVQGTLLRVRKKEAPRIAEARGVSFIYEGYVQGPAKKTEPYGILFVNLPDGVPVSESMKRPVTFYGYFIKKFTYKDGDGKERTTHLLVGPTIHVGETPAIVPTENPVFSREILLFTLGGLLTVGLILFLLTLWFRQGDRKIEQELAALRHRRPLHLGQEAPAEEAPPGANGHAPPGESGPPRG